MECGTSCRFPPEAPDYGRDDEYHVPARTGLEPTVDQILDDPHRGSV
jgi:hypothetical protein